MLFVQSEVAKNCPQIQVSRMNASVINDRALIVVLIPKIVK
jgi:hypothetical protein